MLFNLILTIVLFSANDSVVYINSKGVVKYTFSIPSVNNFNTLTTIINKNTKIENGLIVRKHNDCWVLYDKKGKQLSDTCIHNFKILNQFKIAAQSNNKWAVLNITGTQTTPFIYAGISISDGIMLVKHRNKIDVTDNNLYKSPKTFFFDNISFLDSNYFTFSLDNKLGLCHYKSSKIILNADYDQITKLSDTLFTVTKLKKVGVITSKGNIMIPLVYDKIAYDTLGFIKLAIIKIASLGDITHLKIIDEKYGISNSLGQIIIPTNYEDIGKCTDGLYPVRKDQIWGFFDTNGKEVIPFFYRKTLEFCYGVAAASKGFYYGIIDKRGSWIIPPAYSDITLVNDSLWICTKNDKSGFYFPQTRTLSPLKFDEIKILNDGWFRITQNGNYGLMSPKLKVILPPDFTSVKVSVKENILIGGKLNFYYLYYLNGNLKVFMNYPFTKFTPFIEGMAMVVQNSRYGFIDKDGQLMVSTQYDEARPFSNQMAAVKLNNKWGFVDKKEHIAVSPNYSEVYDYVGNATAVKGEKWAFVNKFGKEILKPQYDLVSKTLSGNFIIKKGTKLGLVDKNGVESINPVYRDCMEMEKNTYKVRNYNKYGLVDINNQPLAPQQFEDILYSPQSKKFIFITKGEWKGL